jgi:hypothetical protein
MEPTGKQKLQAALKTVRKQYEDSIVESIVNEPGKTYLLIAREHGVSEQFVFNAAKLRGVGRKPVEKV